MEKQRAQLMRLGFHYHVPARVRADGIYMPGSQARFIEALAAACEEVVCFLHSPRPEEVTLLDHRIGQSNVSLVDIGPHSSVPTRLLRAGLATALLRRYGSRLDMLLVRGASPLLPAMAAASTLPTALLVVSDYVGGVDDLPQPRWRKELIRLWAYWNRWGQERAMKRSLTFVNSRALYNAFEGKALHLVETRTATLHADEFYRRSDTCQSRPIHLLYVGRMDRTKGLLHMVEAVSLLASRGEDVVLDLVGWPEHNDPVLQEIDRLAKAAHVSERVKYLGPKPFGPELFQCYVRADVFVIASFFEGFPRAIWEAMAHSLPVVATTVGSIPAYVEGAAELVGPKNAPALADAIFRLVHQPSLRQRLIQKGSELAADNTVEAQARTMVDEMERWLRARRPIPAAAAEEGV